MAARKFDPEERLSQIAVEALAQFRDFALVLQMRAMEEMLDASPGDREYMAGRAKAYQQLASSIVSNLNKRNKT